MASTTIRLAVCALFLFLPSTIVNVLSAPTTAARLKNDSGVRVTLSWINPVDFTSAKIGEIEVGGVFELDTFQGHDFEMREVSSTASGVCESSDDRICKINYFKVTEPTEQYFTIKSGLEIVDDRQATTTEMYAQLEPSEVITTCRLDAKEDLYALTGRIPDEEKERKILDRFNTCIKYGLTQKLMQATDEVNFQTDLRVETAKRMENFTCSAINVGTSPDLGTREWTSEKDRVPRKVHIKLDRQASRIHLVENFASPEECEAIEKDAEDRLGLAMTDDGKGGSHLSKHRKAKQAEVYLDWSKEGGGDLITRVSRRVYDYTNHVLGLGLTEHGQEPLMLIQYFGRGYNDTHPDQYAPHCDGLCDGEPFVQGGRAATMVMYCAIPDRGGHTNFQRAGVHVKPIVGSAIFFSYIDPVTNRSDNGLTTHSGCPVYEGQKKIITQWLRYGLDGNHYDEYNTLDVLLSEDGE